MASKELSTKTGGNTQCDVTVNYWQTETEAKFNFNYWGRAKAEYYNPGGKTEPYWRWKGNDAGYVQMAVNGSYTDSCTFTYAKGTWNYAGSTGSTWIDQRSGTSTTITLPGENIAYNITVYYTGSMDTSDGFSVTSFTFTLPIFVNDNGTIKPVAKAYINDNGTIKECTVYFNDNGTVKQLK